MWLFVHVIGDPVTEKMVQSTHNKWKRGTSKLLIFEHVTAIGFILLYFKENMIKNIYAFLSTHPTVRS